MLKRKSRKAYIYLQRIPIVVFLTKLELHVEFELSPKASQQVYNKFP